MKKLKKFQKFTLNAKQASKVRGGYGESLQDYVTCYDGDGSRIGHFSMSRINEAVTFCGGHHDCVGCF